VRVTISDMRPKFCMFGIRKFFTRHDLDLRKFLREGIEAKELEATGDHQAIELVNMVRERNGK